MKKRGKVLRDTNAGQGLVAIEGQQYPFNLEGIWKSDVAPAVNMVVDVELGEDNTIASIQIVPESQLAKEQAAVAVAAAKEKGTKLVAVLVEKFSIQTLAAMAVLALSWFVFSTLSIQVTPTYSVDFSFWRVLAIVNSPISIMNAGAVSGGAGIYGFLAIVAFVAPLTPYFWKDKRSHLGGLFPLLFVLIVCVMIYMGVNDAVKQSQSFSAVFGGPRMANDVASAMAREMMKAFSIGLGGYLSVAVSLYFAGKGTIKFLAARA